MAEPAKLKVTTFSYVICPKTNGVTTVIQCSICTSSGKITEDVLECYNKTDELKRKGEPG